jgi:hypothetical protein
MKKLNEILFLLFLNIFFLYLCGDVVAQPNDLQLKAFRTAKTVQIVVGQTYGIAKDVNLPFEDVAHSLFEYAGLKVVSLDVNNYDLKIKINANGKAIGEIYRGYGNTGSAYLYTGASLNGSISFEIPDIPTYKQYFEGYKKPVESTMPLDREKNPSGAPFKDIFYQRGSFASKITEMIAEIYGTDCILKVLKDGDSNIAAIAQNLLGNLKDPHTVEPLISMIKDESGPIRARAIKALGRIGDPRSLEPLIDVLRIEPNKYIRTDLVTALGDLGDPRAIEPLIATLKDQRVQWMALQSLKRLTEENFGLDQKKWYEWWEQNKEIFLRGR